MPVPFIVEDGTGIATASSYNTIIEIDDAASQHPDGAAWLALTDPLVKQNFAIRGAEEIDLAYGARWASYRNSCEQGLDWPRTGACDASGCSIASDTVPKQVKRAHAFYTFTAAKYPEAAAYPTALDSTSGTAGGVDIIEETNKLGPLQKTVKYASGVAATNTAPASQGLLKITSKTIAGMLRGLLASNHSRMPRG